MKPRAMSTEPKNKLEAKSTRFSLSPILAAKAAKAYLTLAHIATTETQVHKAVHLKNQILTQALETPPPTPQEDMIETQLILQVHAARAHKIMKAIERQKGEDTIQEAKAQRARQDISKADKQMQKEKMEKERAIPIQRITPSCPQSCQHYSDIYCRKHRPYL